MSEDIRPEIVTSLVWRILDGNAVIVSPQTGTYRVLNEVGTVIWQLIEQKLTLTDILDNLVANYETSREEAQYDLHLFLSDLQEWGALKK